MIEKRDNYQIQMQQAKQLFLTYDQQELIQRCHLRYDQDYFYFTMLAEPYRLCRHSGDLQRFCGDSWIDGNSFGEVLTVLDWLCDSSQNRYITGRWINIVTQSHYFHRSLQESRDENAELFDAHPDEFRAACEALGGEKQSGGDVGYTIELFDGLKIFLQLWHADEDFPPKLCCLWEENVLKYIRYETTWYAVGLLMNRLKEKMKEKTP